MWLVIFKNCESGGLCALSFLLGQGEKLGGISSDTMKANENVHPIGNGQWSVQYCISAAELRETGHPQLPWAGRRCAIHPKYQPSEVFSAAQGWSQILWLDFFFLMDCIILWLSRWTNNLQWIIYPTDFDSFAAYWISMSRPRFRLAYLLFEFIWHVPPPSPLLFFKHYQLIRDSSWKSLIVCSWN